MKKQPLLLIFISLFPLLFFTSGILAQSLPNVPSTAKSVYRYPKISIYPQPFINPTHPIEQLKEICSQETTNQDPWLELIQAHLFRRDYQNALDTWQGLNSWCQDSSSLYLMRGEIASAMNNKTEAKDWFEKAIQADPGKAYSYFKLGMAWRDENPQQAISLMERATSLPSAEPWMFHTLGQQYEKANQPGKINPLINRMHRTLPESLDLLMVSGYLYEMAGKQNLAKPYFYQVISQDKNRTTFTQQAISYLISCEKEKNLPRFFESFIQQYPGDTVLVQLSWQALQSNFYLNPTIQLESLDKIQSLLSQKVPEGEFKNYMLTTLVSNSQYRNQGQAMIRLLEARIKKNPQDKDALYMLASLYRSTNQKEKALEYSLAALKLAPENRYFMEIAADTREALGQYAESITLRKAILEINDSPGWRMNRGLRLVRTIQMAGKPDEAEALINQLKGELGGNNNEWVTSLGQYYESIGQKAKALEVYQQYAAVTQVNAYTRHNMARLLNNLGRREEALREYQKILADKKDTSYASSASDGIINYYQETRKPEELWSFFTSFSSQHKREWPYDTFTWRLPSAYQEMGKTNFLIEKLETLYKNKTLTIKEGTILVNAYNQSNRYEEGLPVYEYLHTLDAADQNVISQLINRYQQKAQWDKIIKLGEEALSRDSSSIIQFATPMGKAYLQSGRMQDLESLIRTLKDKAESQPATLRVLAEVYKNIGRLDLAIDTYEQVPIPVSDNPSQQENLFYERTFYLGQLYSQASQYQKAIRLYEDYLKKTRAPLSRNNTAAYQNLINCNLNAGNIKKATYWIKKLNQLEPSPWGNQYPFYYNNFITQISRQGDIQKAWKLIEAYYTEFKKTNPDLSPWEAAQKMTSQGNILPWENRLKWIPVLEPMVNRKSRNPMVYICLKEVYQQDWNIYRARGVDFWQTAIKLFPKEPAPYEYLGELATNAMNNKAMGIPAYEKALRLYEAKKNDSKIANILSLLSIHYFNNKQNDKAQDCILTYQAYLEKNNPYFSWMQMGSIYEQIQDPAQALVAYQKALDIALTKPEQSNQLGQIKMSMSRCYLQLKQYDKAEETLQLLLKDREFMKQNEYLYDQLARIYDGQGLYEKELQTLLQLIKANPRRFEYSSPIQELMNYGDPNNRTRLEKLAQVCEKRLKEHPDDWVTQGILSGLWLRLGKSSDDKAN